MNNLAVLIPMFGLLGVGVGTAAAYSVSQGSRRIHFVEENNLETELSQLDIDVGGSEQCVECGNVIDPDEVGAIVLEEGEYQVVCDDPICLDTYDL